MTQEDINAVWDMRSDNFSDYVTAELFESERPEKWLRQIEEQMGRKGSWRVLDAGCGPGFFTILLTRAGHRVTGVDGAEQMLEHARENAEQAGIQADFRRMDFGKLDFADDTFDLVISRNVTHIIRDHDSVYREWKRVLKPGGKLLIFDANWHLPYVEGPIREEAIRRERETLRRYGSNFSCEEEPYEYIGSELMPENFRVFGDRVRPDFDVEILKNAGYTSIFFDRDVTEELWSEKEKFMYHATPLFMLSAYK